MSKELCGPQQSHPLIQFRLNKYLKMKKLKIVLKFFPFINFLNPLYISTKQEVKFGLTSGTARIFFAVANPNKIILWMGISFKLIHFPEKWIFGTRYYASYYAPL